MNALNKIALSTSGIPAPGQLLAVKRVENGWTTQDVARVMRLSEKQILAIESDDYENLPGKTYIMGYWRSYSQLLKISIDESIDVHRANLSPALREVPAAPSPVHVRGKEEKSRKHSAGLFACLLAAFLLAIWYWQDPDAQLSHWVSANIDKLNTLTETPTVDSAGQTLDDTELSGMIEPVDELPVASVLALPIPNFAEDQQTVEINTSGYEVTVIDLPLSRRDLVYQQKVPTPEELAAEAAAAKLAAAESSGASQARRSNSQQAASSSNNAASQSNSATNAVAVQTINIQPTDLATTTTRRNTNSASKIVFKVEKESWIDVRDNTGERLIYRTVNRGEDIRLDGQPPYSVFIGSIEGVSVEYKGKPIKFKAHESGLFARFEVGNQ